MTEKEKKYCGRPKGAVNKVTKSKREFINGLLNGYFESELFKTDWKDVDPKDRLMFAEKLLQYTTPKMQAISADVQATVQQKTIEDKLEELSEDIY